MGSELNPPPLSADEKAFIVAAAKGDVAALRECLAKGVPVNLRDSETLTLGGAWNITALMCAARNGHLEAARVLLKAGADVSAADNAHKQDGSGGTQALHYAMAGKNLEVAEALLNAGADPNAVGGSGRTPLTAAIYDGNFEGAKFLLKRGADTKLQPRRKDHEPPLCAAASFINNTTALVARGGRLVLEAEELWAKKSEVVGLFEALLAAGADPNAPGRSNETPVKILARGYEMPEELRVEIIEKLIKAGANLNVADKNGQTALLTAAQYDNPRITKLLCDAGADVNRIGNAGTALDLTEQNIARYQGELGRPDVAARFREAMEPRLKRAQEVRRVLGEAGAKRKSELPAAPVPLPAKTRKLNAATLGAGRFLEFIYDGEPEWALFAVCAPFEQVAEAVVKLFKPTKHLPGVAVKAAASEADEVADLVPVVELRENPWTVVFLSLFHVDEIQQKQVADAAKRLSEELQAKAISFCGEDKSGMQEYHLFEKGKSVEHAILEEGARLHEFESHRRKAPKPESVGKDFLDELFRQEGILLPACYPQTKGKRAWLATDKASLKNIGRVDFLAVGP